MINNYLFKTTILTSLALIAFAANSVLCRIALGDEAIDASSFTIIRLFSGAIVSIIIICITAKTAEITTKGSWTAGFMLFLYAVTFSYAYVSLDTGTGALILFGAVQVTMILVSLMSGTRLHITEWAGVTIAFTGFIYLMLPDATMPSATGFLLMTVAGIAWGIYTLQGRTSKNPLMDTAYNFIRATPFVAILAILTFKNMNFSSEGIALALISGAVTSAIGYTIWYVALGDLTSTQAAVLQLSVPIIAALGGIVFVAEAITFRLTVSAATVLGGILIVILGKYYSTQKQSGK